MRGRCRNVLRLGGGSGRAQGTKHKAQNVGDGEKLTHPLDFYAANMIQYTAYVQFG